MSMDEGLLLVSVDVIPNAKECPEDNLAEIYRICLLMEEVCDKEQGIGLSAVQVGIPWQLFIVKFPLTESDSPYYRHFVNCKYEGVGEEKGRSLESCLSLKNDKGNLRYFDVDRYKSIQFTGKELITESKLSLADVSMKSEDYYRIVYQHEIDHHFGILISDIGKEFEILRGIC